MRLLSYTDGDTRSALTRRMGEGSEGITGNREGNVCRTARALSKAMRPNTISTFVIRKKKASLQACQTDLQKFQGLLTPLLGRPKDAIQALFPIQ